MMAHPTGLPCRSAATPSARLRRSDSERGSNCHETPRGWPSGEGRPLGAPDRIRTCDLCLRREVVADESYGNQAVPRLLIAVQTKNSRENLWKCTGVAPDPQRRVRSGSPPPLKRKTAGRAGTLRSGKFHSVAAILCVYASSESRERANLVGSEK